MNDTTRKNNEQERIRIADTWRKIAEWAWDMAKSDAELAEMINEQEGILGGDITPKDIAQYRCFLKSCIDSSLFWIAEREKGLALLQKIEEHPQ